MIIPNISQHIMFQTINQPWTEPIVYIDPRRTRLAFGFSTGAMAGKAPLESVSSPRAKGNLFFFGVDSIISWGYGGDITWYITIRNWDIYREKWSNHQTLECSTWFNRIQHDLIMSNQWITENNGDIAEVNQANRKVYPQTVEVLQDNARVWDFCAESVQIVSLQSMQKR